MKIHDIRSEFNRQQCSCKLKIGRHFMAFMCNDLAELYRV